MAVAVVSRGGRQYRMGSSIVVENAQEAYVYITGRTGFRSENPQHWCEEVLNQSERAGYEKLKETHICDFEPLMNKIQLKLGEKSTEKIDVSEAIQTLKSGILDKKLVQAYFDFGKYLFISSSRKGSLPSTLQGIWNKDIMPIWGSRYTININLQMNYWMAEKCGYSEEHLPFFELLKRMHPHGCKVAKDMYGVEGFCCHHNTDIWGDCAPQDRSEAATIWPMGGAWMALHIMEHYRYTKDVGFLKTMYPVLRDSVKFYENYMVRNDVGEWLTGPSSSPENSYYSKTGDVGALCMGSAMDSQIIYELFSDYIEAYQVLEKDKVTTEDRETFECACQMREELPPIKIGKYQQIQEWAEDYEEIEPGHRHVSQLFALYPAGQIRLDKTPEYAEAARKTLERRLENGGGHTGWSRAWLIHFFARLGEAEDVYSNLKELLAVSTYDNLFDKCPPFQIDGNFGGTNAILEMMVQDYGEDVWLLPALPDEFSEGSLFGIHLKAGAVLDMIWKEKMVNKVCIKAVRDAKFSLKLNRKLKTISLSEGECFQWEVTKDEKL